MPDEDKNKPAPAPKLASEEQFEKALEHLSNIETLVVKRGHGKDSMNPYAWVAKNVTPLRIAHANGDRSETLLKAMMAVKETDPVIKNPTIPTINAPGVPNKATGGVDQGVDPNAKAPAAA